jgi:ABC-type uncharacterized transport system substrate-binding protein
METFETLKRYRKKGVSFFPVVFLMGISLFFFTGKLAAEKPGPAEAKWKILHIMSYHAPWKWTDDQLAGFKDALKGLKIEYKVFQMDTKRKSKEEWKQKVGKEARDLINTWKPDLVYTNDDNAQEYVARYYINKPTPFVFSGVNAPPETYGFLGSKNITGVMEQEHFIESVQLLREIAPNIRRVGVIVDEGSTWAGVIERMKQALHQVPDVDFVSWDVIHTYEDYKKKIIEYQTGVDAIALLGIFTYKDRNGENVPYREVLRWTTENSRLPDFSFWKDRISHGTLCTVTVSGYEQGLAAGKLARGILIDGRSPSSYPMKPTVKGEPVVSLARANKLGIKIKTGILLSAQVIKEFSWEQ